MDKVVHFEIPADDVERAKKFYMDNFGWKITPMPEMSYNILHTVEVDEKNMPKENGAINGGMMKRDKDVKSPVITIAVEDIKKSLDKVKKSGGKIIRGPDQVGDMGLLAYIKDSEGNVISLWQNLRGM